ncbi:MAG TPA: ATP-binding protein [Oligoflexia bacterium]|nr:ATP-binding protein [Oligoflexia bacterium]HMP48574.1 ATP-binding protein [Oligoflexia bacterium]
MTMEIDLPWVRSALKLLNESLDVVSTEPNQLDWKIDLSQDKEKLTQHLSAFANHVGGGFLVFGISDSRKVFGISTQDVDNIVNRLANIGRDTLEPPVVIDHVVRTFNDKQVLIVRVQESITKPAHRRGKSVEHSYIRSGGSTRRASRQEVGSMMLNSESPCWENIRATTVLEIDQIINALDIDKILHLLERPPLRSQDALREWLLSESMIIEESNGYSISNLGAISAAKDLKFFSRLERKMMRIIRYKGVNKVDTISEKVDSSGYAVGFEGAISYIKNLVPHSEVIQLALRTKVSIYPEIALRELVANALIHQDFSISGAGPMIEIFDDRIEFHNPGGLLPSKLIDRLIGASPESRNEKLAAAFRRYRICEERGSGFEKVVASIELYGLPPLGFRQEENAFIVILYAPKKFSEMSVKERVEACYQHSVLQFLSNNAMTNTSLRKRFKMHEKQRNQITNLISEATTAGRIKRKDPDAGNKFAEYIPYWV